jgi:hypothetical protein
MLIWTEEDGHGNENAESGIRDESNDVYNQD